MVYNISPAPKENKIVLTDAQRSLLQFMTKRRYGSFTLVIEENKPKQILNSEYSIKLRRKV